MNLLDDGYWMIDPDTPEKCNKEVNDLFNYRFFMLLLNVMKNLYYEMD